jgi:hypothetical protein
MEALQIVLPGEVNIVSYYALGSTRYRPVRHCSLCLSFARPLEAF